jgi:hypothetical protein
MARRRTRRKTRRSRSFSLINALEAYTYASILSEGVAGTSPWGMLTGEKDIGYVTEKQKFGTTWVTDEVAVGTDEISLRDIVSAPGQSFGVLSANLQKNLIPMAVASMVTSVGFRFGKRLLRRPIGNINRNIMKPLLGAGVKL